MPCPKCGSEAISALGHCSTCGSAEVDTILPPAVHSDHSTDPASTAEAATAVTPLRPASSSTTGFARGGNIGIGGGATPPIAAGQPFGSRYHVIRVLGAGGMGVVYHAWDAELGVAVALKVIRPEVLQDPGAAGEVERRFKRELVLARQVTHKNVVRIHDLGEIDGVKYLTMPFVEGDNLATMLKQHGKLPLPQALAIARQVASGLAAAHEVGVVHRDLKPENIMIDAEGDALIMDFGISRSVSGTGTATALGAVLGTLEYMPPEQAQGKSVDHRADIYSFGLVLYDMLTGRQRLAGRESPMSEVLARMQSGVPAIRSIDATIPDAVEGILQRCLASEPEARYATTAELVRDLESLTPDGHRIQPAVPAPAAAVPRRTVAIGAAVLVLILGAAGWWAWRQRGPAAPVSTEPVSVLVANFDNLANDEQFDGLLEQAMAVGIEGTSFVTAFPRKDALRVAEQIAPDKPLNEEVARLISRREGIDIIVAGAIDFEGGKYTLSVRLLNPVEEAPLLEWSTAVSSKNDVLGAVGQGAAKVRNSLGDTQADDTGAAETFTAGSLDAAHAYARAQEHTWAGENDKAVAAYERAVALDPQLGRAYSGLAALHYNAGRRDKAVEFYQKALAHTDRMTERERLRTRGGYYLVTRNSAKAIEEFQALLEKYPADSAALANLAVNYVYDRQMGKALEVGRRAAAIYPNNVIRRNNVALFAMYAGEFADAEREARAVLELQPEFPKAFVALAMAQLATGQPAEAEATWRKLRRVPDGLEFALAGLADLAMYQGRLSEAERLLREAPPAQGALATRRLVTVAEIQMLQGNESAAVTAATTAAAKGPGDPAVVFLAGRVLAEARRPQAAALAAALSAELDREPQIHGALLAGEIALANGDARASVEHFREAQKLADTWLGRYGMGRALLAAEKYPEAESEFDACLKRRGEATAVFLDEIPTYRLVAPVHYYMGLVREGLKNDRGAAESLRAFLQLKEGGDEQGLVADARRRLSTGTR